MPQPTPQYSYFVSGHAIINPAGSTAPYTVPFETVIERDRPVTNETGLMLVRDECLKEVQESIGTVGQVTDITVRVLTLVSVPIFAMKEDTDNARD